MKDNNVNNKRDEDGNADEEKSDFVQLQEDAKQSIFSVFYLLLKDNEQSVIKFTMILVLEYIQLLSFSFDESVHEKWNAKDVTNYFTQFLSTFRVVYWLKMLSWDIYIIIFYICVFLVFVIIIDFLYVSFSYRMKKLNFMQPVQLLKTGCLLIVTVLYIPITELFISLSACHKNPQVAGELIHVKYSTVICFQSIHVVHIAISYLMLFLFGLMAYFTITLFYESRYVRSPLSKINTECDLFMLISKSLYVFFFTLFSEYEYAIFKAIILTALSTITCYCYLFHRPYNSIPVQITVEIFSSIFCWTNWVLLFTLVLQGTQFTGSLEILFLGIPIITAIIYTRHDGRLKLLMTSEKRIDTGDLCRKKNFYYFYIIDTREMIRQSGIILKGYVNHHTTVCPYDTCPIKAFKRLMMKEKLTTMIERKKWASNDSKNMHTDNNQLLLAQARALYLNGMRKFTKYAQLRIDFANFLLTRMKDRKGALAELTNAEKLKLSLDQQFMIFRLRRIIEDELSEGHENGGIDFIAAMNFESIFKMFKSLVEKSAMLHFEFWNHLQDDQPDLVRLSTQGTKINQSILAVEDQWKKLSRMSSNAPRAIKLYASYLIEILNDKETGNEQMAKAKEAANMRTNFDFAGGGLKQEGDINQYAQDGTPCVYISGENDRLGLINQCNMSLCKIFGYQKKDDLINKNINILQPEIYSEQHDKFLKESIQKSAELLSSRERQIFGKHVSGYILPLWLQIKNLPSMLSGRQFVATFKVEKNGINKSSAYLIFNRRGELMDVSTSCLSMLGISADMLSKKQIYFDVPQLFPQLFSNKGEPSYQYLNKAGSSLTYFYPQIINYVATLKASEKVEDSDPFNEEGGAMDFMRRPGGEGEGEDNIYQDPPEDYGDGARSNTLSQQKSVMSARTVTPNVVSPTKAVSNLDDNDDEPVDNEVRFQFRAVASQNYANFHANISDITFEMIQLQAGYFLKLESNNNQSGVHQGVPKGNVEKRVIQQAFQFSYDPIFKRFNRELRDADNKHFLMDQNYLDLKLKKEQSQAAGANTDDPNLHRYANMSYINYLQRQQKKIERGIFNDEELDDEEEEEGQSEEESEVSRTNDGKSERQKSLKQTFKETEAQKIAAAQAVQKQNFMNAQTGAIDMKKALVAQEGYGKEFLKNEIERLIRILQDKQNCGQGVTTFVRSEGARSGWEEDNNQKAGLFSDRGGDIDKVGNEDEEHEEKQKDSQDKSGDGDALKTNIKSKKAFSMAINDKTMPPAIKRLSTAAQILMLCLVAIAIIEYAIIYKQFSDIKQNFMLIEKSYLRTAELQKVVYHARSMIFMSQGLITNYRTYATQAEAVAAIKQEFSASLDLIYDIQNEINLSQLSVSDEQDQLLNNKTVTLYFRENANSMKALYFSLTESILQISSTIFTISNMKLNEFNENNEDVFFLMYNSFNEFYIGLLKSSELYLREMGERTSQKEEISLILYILALISLAFSFVVLIPVVTNVNQQKDRVLNLFCEIDNSVLKILGSRCERFINSLQAEENNDDINSNDDMEEQLPQDDENEEYGLMSGGSSSRTKKSKGNTKTESGFYFKFFVALLIIQAYYLQNFLLNTDAAKAAEVYNSELNVTAMSEPFYWFSLNSMRELVANKDRVIMKQDPLKVTIENLYRLFDHQNELQITHLSHDDTLSDSYKEEFDQLMHYDLCPMISYFTNTTTQCKDYVSGTLKQGLHVAFIRYFETTRNIINAYQNYIFAKNDTAIKNLANSNGLYELFVVQNYVTQPFMRQLVNILSTQIQEEFTFRTERKLAIFIVFLIVLLLSFIIFWLPFLNGLNLQIYKTKLMLMIIPLEVLLKIKNVGKVLQSQNFIGTQHKKNSSQSKTSRKKPEHT